MNRRILFGFLIAVAIIAADQCSTRLALESLSPDQPALAITPFFNLALVWNRGISFGMMASQNQPMIWVALSAAIAIILLKWLMQTPSPLIACALGGIIGGAAGNVIDRLRFGAVADFLDFHINTLHWPAFNIADSAIVIGVVVLCLESMFTPRHKGYSS